MIPCDSTIARSPGVHSTIRHPMLRTFSSTYDTPRFPDGEAERLETVFYESRLQSLTGCGNLKGHRGVLFGRTAEPS